MQRTLMMTLALLGLLTAPMQAQQQTSLVPEHSGALVACTGETSWVGHSVGVVATLRIAYYGGPTYDYTNPQLNQQDSARAISMAYLESAPGQFTCIADFYGDGQYVGSIITGPFEF